MLHMITREWLRQTAERAVRTFLQAWLGAWLVIESVTLEQLFDTDIVTVGVVAAVGSVLCSLGAKRIGDADSASFIE